MILEEIENRENLTLERTKNSHLKDYMQNEKKILECGKQNVIRLTERFKHDDSKFNQVTQDWIDYLGLLDDIIHESEMLDVSTSETSDFHWKKRDELITKTQEIEKRFKDLLRDDYLDPFPRQNKK